MGASGATSGILGGAVPALVMLGLWILIQFLSGFGAMARTEQAGEGGAAYMAHAGGFVAGLVLVRLFAAGRRVPAYVTPVR